MYWYFDYCTAWSGIHMLGLCSDRPIGYSAALQYHADQRDLRCERMTLMSFAFAARAFVCTVEAVRN